MGSKDIEIIEQEMAKRIWDICKEYGDAFDIDTQKSRQGYTISIICNFPGIREREIVLYVQDVTSIREFTPAERDLIKRICYEIRLTNRYIARSHLRGIHLGELRKKFLDSSIYDRLNTKGYQKIDVGRFKFIEKKLMKITGIPPLFFVGEMIAITYLANAIILKEKYKRGDIVKKRVLERAIGLYCYIIGFIASKKKIKVPPEISDMCSQTKSYVKKQDFEILILSGEDFDDVLDKIMFRAEIRWERSKLKRWFRAG